MNKPVRIQRSRQHKQVSPNGLPIIYVGRPSKWGNPFKIGDKISAKDIGNESPLPIKILQTPFQVVLAYRFWVDNTPAGARLKKDVSELKGKNLACWCKIGEPCHADILLKLANT